MVGIDAGERSGGVVKSTVKERPMLFSGAMVRAILEGRKSQTRRVIKPQPPEGCTVGWSAFSGEDKIECRSYAIPHQSFIKVPYGKRGDRVWVKETFQYTDGSLNFQPGWVYRATDPDWETLEDWKWKPSIFMPRKASRITLEITAIRVERLQDISEEDAVAEGACIKLVGHDDDFARNCYRKLWESINGKGSWDKNPFVWVVSFKRIEQKATE